MRLVGVDLGKKCEHARLLSAGCSPDSQSLDGHKGTIHESWSGANTTTDRSLPACGPGSACHDADAAGAVCGAHSHVPDDAGDLLDVCASRLKDRTARHAN